MTEEESQTIDQTGGRRRKKKARRKGHTFRLGNKPLRPIRENYFGRAPGRRPIEQDTAKSIRRTIRALETRIIQLEKLKDKTPKSSGKKDEIERVLLATALSKDNLERAFRKRQEEAEVGKEIIRQAQLSRLQEQSERAAQASELALQALRSISSQPQISGEREFDVIPDISEVAEQPSIKEGKEEEELTPPPNLPRQKLERKSSVKELVGKFEPTIQDIAMQKSADLIRSKFSVPAGSAEATINQKIAKLVVPDYKIRYNIRGSMVKADDLERILSNAGILEPIKFINEATKVLKSGSDKDKIKLAKKIADRRQMSFEDFAKETVGKGSTRSNGEPLTNHEIDNIMSALVRQEMIPDVYIGTFASDEIDKPEVTKKMIDLPQFCFIMNLDPAKKKGSHWVACYCDKPDDMSFEYYDSFGDEPTKDFMTRMRDIICKMDLPYMLKMKINGIPNQHSSSANCGWFCIKFLYDRLNGVSWKQATGFDNKPVVNEMEKKINKFKGKFKFS